MTINSRPSKRRSSFGRNKTQIKSQSTRQIDRQQIMVKLTTDETVKKVYSYLTSWKFNAESSAKAVSRTVGMFIKTFKITAPDIAGLRKLADIIDKLGLENTTRRFYIACFQNWAEATGRPVDTKQVFSRKPPLNDNMICAIPLEKIQAIPEQCDNGRDLAIMMTGFYCGIRGIEAVRLLMKDVDIYNRVIAIKNRGMQTLKNRRERCVPIPDELVPYLEEWLQIRTDYLVRQKVNLEPQDDYFYITNRCTPMSVGLVRGMMWRFKSKIGYKKGERFSFHLTRHTCNSNALANGASLDDCIENF